MPKAIPRKRGHLSKEHTEKESQQKQQPKVRWITP